MNPPHPGRPLPRPSGTTPGRQGRASRPPRSLVPRRLRARDSAPLSPVHRTCHGTCFALRASTCRARCYVVGDVHRPRCSDALCVLAPSALAPSPCRRPLRGMITAAAYAPAAPTAPVFARATVAGNAPGHRTRYLPRVVMPDAAHRSRQRPPAERPPCQGSLAASRLSRYASESGHLQSAFAIGRTHLLYPGSERADELGTSR